MLAAQPSTLLHSKKKHNNKHFSHKLLVFAQIYYNFQFYQLEHYHLLIFITSARQTIGECKSKHLTGCSFRSLVVANAYLQFLYIK